MPISVSPRLVVFFLCWCLPAFGAWLILRGLAHTGPSAVYDLDIGVVLFLTGAAIVLRRYFVYRRSNSLRHRGLIYWADFAGVREDLNKSINGHHPFRVVARWRNESTLEVSTFESPNYWFNPTQYVEGKPITVYVDPLDPDKYFMDLPGMPKWSWLA